MWTYAAKVVRIVDGDTVDLSVDLGFFVYTAQRFRLAGLNAPETNAPDAAQREAAIATKTRLAELLPLDSACTVVTVRDKKEKYGRWLGTIANQRGVNVNEALLVEGLALPYSGGPRV